MAPARQLHGDQTVEVKVFHGDADKAIATAVHANIAHGLPLTLAASQTSQTVESRLWRRHCS